ncbi:MAG TPA: 16S rRNA (cytidine(1402)-2'-O)-methyltransferase [Anaerolineae bacterium]|nr:16S rRNA (cytidine(1402)-2'-O)-methyltransferase [Anaerolineae bacterium]HID85517.1 16S rRNA (cytidine(1402)-2'-O)-methyltransferase [Anaerolineales bacterium]HIQ09694.1 16S rRNA (cytidine(1402)-2'-O)-methyltransferase [Anaerolineaceae bacterium]
MPTLYLVSTPIGNLEDITLRALRVLREVSLIAAEDTRRTRQLLRHYDIATPLLSFHEHNKAERIPRLLRALAQGDVALVSDAGTPLVNDPGYELVVAAIEAGFPVVPVPGPSAPLAALVASGLPTDAFLYLGYLPRKAGERRRRLEQVAGLPYTLLFLETPQRLRAALRDLGAVLGPHRRIAIARELTKVHEEIWRGTLEQAVAHFQQHEPRGEFTLVVAGAPSEVREWNEGELDEAIAHGLAQGVPPSRLARELAGLSGKPRRWIYRRILERAQRET